MALSPSAGSIADWIPAAVTGESAFIAVTTSLIALLLAKGAVAYGRTALAIRRIELSPVGAVSPGAVEVRGRVRPAGHTLRSALGEECVAYRIQLREQSESGDDSDGGAVPFFVEDDTGEVLVDVVPRKPDLSETGGRTLFQRLNRKSGSDTEVSRISWGSYERASVEEADWSPGIFAGAGGMGVREGRLEPGDEVYVLATAVDETLHGERPVLVNRTDGPFVVAATDGESDPEADQFRTHALIAAAGGAVSFVLFAVVVGVLLA